MKILYRQPQGENVCPLARVSVSECYLKEIHQNRDHRITTAKTHWHDFYEVHILFRGSQRYEIDGREYALGEDDFLLIAPKHRHRVVDFSDDLMKYSLIFRLPEGLREEVISGRITQSIRAALCFVSEEVGRKTTLSGILIENRVLELLTLLLRLCGKEERAFLPDPSADNPQLRLARAFIRDNLEQGVSVRDVADYCHISVRQLSRLFAAAQQLPPAKYIHHEKMAEISECLKSTELSLRAISERYAFANEFCFNTAFRKHFGIPPLAYRKMYRETTF